MAPPSNHDSVFDVWQGILAIDDAEELEDTMSHLREVLGRPLTPEEQEDLDRARATAAELREKHGADYHGFGDPPDWARPSE